MRSFVNIIFTWGFVVFRFRRLVLPVVCRLEPIDKHGNHLPLACFRPSYQLLLSSLSTFLLFFRPSILLFSYIISSSSPTHYLSTRDFLHLLRSIYRSDSYKSVLFLSSTDCMPYSWQQCCCIATDKSHNCAVFIPAQSLVNKRVFCVTKDLRRSTQYRDKRYHELPPSPQVDTTKQDKTSWSPDISVPLSRESFEFNNL
jgi:hypothetical protein